MESFLGGEYSRLERTPVINEFIRLWENYFADSEAINKLIPKLVKEIAPDQFIRIEASLHDEYASLLHRFIFYPKIDYELLFQSERERIDCNLFLGDMLHFITHVGNETKKQ